MKNDTMLLQLFAEAEEPEAAVSQEAAPEAAAPEAAAPTENRYAAMEPVLDALAARLGIAAGDGEALSKALQQRQEEQGKEVMETIRQGADRIYQSWMTEAEQLKQLYPDFDLRQEMRDPKFAGLLRSRIDMQTAYEVLHNRQILPAAMEYAARTTQQRLASALRSGSGRPAENGIRGSGAVMLGSDVAHMSRKDYAAVCRMVERGERVSFG